MVAISLKLPDDLVEESTRIARGLGMTPEQLMHQALRHELLHLQRQQEQRAMASSFSAMRNHQGYLAEVDALDQTLAADLPDEPEDWWNDRSR